ncbi:MAG TPA: DUF4347 domain-containing protein, partial [Gammaproteobacteria bacterium]|nr:DUF4347 domain-containing protein [Gammaproteobacteria bacterium]
MLALEPRFLFDVAALATGVDHLTDPDAIDSDFFSIQDTDQNNSDPVLDLFSAHVPPSGGNNGNNEIVFVDSTARLADTLLEQINPDIEVIQLDSKQSGIQQISDVLNNRENITTVHLVTQALNDSIQLGNIQLSADNADDYYTEIQGWSKSLTSTANINLYDGNIAKTDTGNSLIETLGSWTSANIWTLENDTGSLADGSDVSDGSDISDGDHLIESNTAETSIVFVDSRVQDPEVLLAGISSQTEIIYLDAARDGIDQISDVLSGRNNVSSIHIVSHGDVGSVQLGSTELNLASLDRYSQQLSGWASSLTSSADILLYGCLVGGNEAGIDFVERIAELTGADIAASDDITGNSVLGGDWILEINKGNVENTAIFTQSAMNDYKWILATNTWQGGVSSNWTDAGNWSLGYVPIYSNDVYIGKGATGSSINFNFTGTQTIDSLRIANSDKLNLQSGNLTIGIFNGTAGQPLDGLIPGSTDTVKVETGSYIYQTGGVLTVGSSATGFPGRTTAVDAGANLYLYGGTTYFQGVTNVNGRYYVNGTNTTYQNGSLAINTGASLTVSSASSNTATLTGDGYIYVYSGGALNWSGGTIGTTTDGRYIWSKSGSTVSISGSLDKTLDTRDWYTDSKTTWSGSGNLGLQNGAFIKNGLTTSRSGAFDITATGSLYSLGGTNSSSTIFVNGNISTLNTNVASGSAASISVPFVNDGTLNVNSGELSLGNNNLYPGTANIANGATLRLVNGATHDFTGGTISLSGNIIFQQGGAATVDNFTDTGTGRTVVDTNQGKTVGSVSFLRTENFTNLDVLSGTLFTQGYINISTAFTWSGGTISGVNGYYIYTQSGSNNNISGSGNKLLSDLNWYNYGTTTWSGSGDIQLQNGVTIYNGSSGSIAGILDMQTTGSITGIDTAAYSFQNRTPSSLTGNGSIGINVTNNGLLSPGASPGSGTININSNYSSTGVIDIEIGGTVAGQYDVVNITGTATINGTINVSLINDYFVNYEPLVGDVFTIMTYAAISGAPVFNGLQVSPHIYLQANFSGSVSTPGALTLTALQTNKPPTATNVLRSFTEDSNNNSLSITAPTDPDNDPLTITVTSLPNPSLGTVTTSSGVPITIGQTFSVTTLTSLLFDTTPDANGTGGFSYTVADAFGGSVTGSVSVTVTAVADTTVAVDDPIGSGGFENVAGATGILTQWQQAGSVSLVDSTFGAGPTQGTAQALLSTANGIGLPSLESFFGLNQGDLSIMHDRFDDTLLNNSQTGQATEGVGIKQTITVAAGDTISFDWNFLTNEGAGSSYRDYAFVVLGDLTDGGRVLADTTSVLVTSATGFSNETGYQTLANQFTHTFTKAGTYILGIGVVNLRDGTADSGLLIDNLQRTSAAYTTDDNTVLSVNAANGILVNDFNGDGSTISVAGSSPTSTLGATVNVNADGSFSYDPTTSSTLNALAPGASLTDTFTYTTNGIDSATVSIVVNGANDAP